MQVLRNIFFPTFRQLISVRLVPAGGSDVEAWRGVNPSRILQVEGDEEGSKEMRQNSISENVQMIKDQNR